MGLTTRKGTAQHIGLGRFLRDQSGAITADWVVVSAATIGLGLSSVVAVRNGSNELGANIMRSLAESQVASMILTAAGLQDEPVEETLNPTTLADGRIQTDVYVDGKLVRREVTDPTNKHAWATHVTHYDSNGVRVGEDITYDDGRISETAYANGVRTNQKWQDPNNLHSWSKIDYLYDKDGKVTSAVVKNDNMTSYSHTYNTDGRVTSTVHRNADGKMTSSEAHSYTLDDSGKMVGRTIDYSDGRFLSTTYENGKPTSQVQIDRNDVHTFKDQSWTYDAQGRVVQNIINYDDGSAREYNHVEGRITENIHRNSAGQVRSVEARSYDDAGRLATMVSTGANGAIISSEARGYDDAGRLTSMVKTGENGTAISAETRSYDTLGRLSAQVIEHGDGRVQTVDYVDGLRRTQTITDPLNASSISKQTWQFDETNRTAGYTIEYDDGRQRLETYINGRTSEYVLRTATGTVQESATYNYTTDEFDRLTGRTINYSDGRESVTTYNANRPLVQTITDTNNVHSWSNQVHTYDSMHRTSNVVVNYNDGRQYEDRYTEGVRVERIWRDAEGNITSTQTF
jgi:antitoxin component YwqK of YwqJK toxin-antitoxin module